MERNTLRDILTKRPWSEPLPGPDGSPLAMRDYTQDDFLRQYFPSGHRILDRAAYPDIHRVVSEPEYDAWGNPTGRTVSSAYVELVPRDTFAFQQVIALKQTIHVTGNDVQFDLDTDDGDPAASDALHSLMHGWHEKGMERALFELVRSVKCTGDGAVAGFIDGGKRFGARALGRLRGDTLYPHYAADGRLKSFARRYSAPGPDGAGAAEWVEVWDDSTLTRYVRTPSASGRRGGGFSEVDSRPHGFPRVPVAYMRCEEGPCWAASQRSIDAFELASSQMSQNNKAYGMPILAIRSESANVEHGPDGAIKQLTMGPDDDASFLPGQSASDSYMQELDRLYKLIYEQSFAVIPPQLTSTDVSGVALKILYSPAYEKAMADAKEYDAALRDMVDVFRYGYGLETGRTIDFMSLRVVPWLKPYIHLSESSVVQDLAAGVQNGFISRRTASEKAWFYAQDNEWRRVEAERAAEASGDPLAMYGDERYGAGLANPPENA